MNEHPLKLTVILGSVRNGRFGPTVARWFAELADTRPELAVEFVDLLEYPLPMVMPEPGEAPDPEADQVRRSLSVRLAEADVFVVVTPEYNHSMPAALKNAIDWFSGEWAAKPIGFVSYGGMGGGLRAVEHLRQVFGELHAVSVRESLSFHNFWDQFDGNRPLDVDDAESAAKTMLDRLVWWGELLRTARTYRPLER
ncbi:NAD(P)H-dependent FMN reductase [Actinopolyspora biskrensis]|uniref:NAD(P)H-dependent FMN reductase n=1 Tax=Actinopolyspora biskrensis TaxID=1470178 RepID=A0A852Z5U4_9ACTN|nr:NAD(P)H-dependent oxidoreductase [Actinopolyspora biskrensis]NYH77583.1 NAD(P)H-dependent FMN reductase [Actinopolyspora biskrensis]